MNVLDLAITVGPPPPGAGPEVLGSIALTCDALGLSHAADPLVDPLSDGERKELDWYLEEFWKWPFEGFADRGARIERTLPEIGRRLFRSAFGSADAHGIFLQWHREPLEEGQRRQISLRTVLPAALRLPWELLHDEQGYLVLRTRNPVSIVRRLPQAQLGDRSAKFEPPLRILLVTARPSGKGFIDPRSISRALLDALEPLAEAGSVEIEVLRPPTLSALRTRLRDEERPVHVLHFDGHGHFEPAAAAHGGPCMDGGTGTLAFEDEDGGHAPVAAPQLAQVLQNSGVPLVVLNACRSARGGDGDTFSSVAAALVRSGIDAVVAMSAKVLVVAATRYVEAFYGAIAEGEPVPAAHERGRQRLHDEPRRHVYRRRREERGDPVTLCDFWLPHFYQQRPLQLSPRAPASRRSPREAPRFTGLPDDPRYGFAGRGRELLDIERALFRGKIVLLHGFGGTGKTALAAEAARWLCRTGMYRGACFISFEHGGDAARVLGRLAEHLDVGDSAFDPGDEKAALARLVPALVERPTLLVVDNLESVLPDGEAALPAGDRAALWQALVQLAAAPKGGCGVILTSRDAGLGDGRLAPGQRTMHREVRGMDPDDAYALAARLLGDLGIDPKRAPYPELRDLLEKLDHHPLAIQLVLRALGDRTLTLKAIDEEFATLLPTFTDDLETGRSRSLVASLEYSLRRLSEEQRSFLLRLAPFEGGAHEENLLAIAEIPEESWTRLRPALEQAALIRAEKVHKEIKYPFLYFHPALSPYLRTQANANIETTRERYTQRYTQLANGLRSEDSHHPQPTRALFKLELPNLRRALRLQIAASAIEEASRMANGIDYFLRLFGYRRELDEMRRQINNLVAAPRRATDGSLTQAEYLHECAIGEDALDSGNINAALNRFVALLQRTQTLPEGTTLGPGSYEHCIILTSIGRCLLAGGQLALAQARCQEALNVIETLIQRNQDNEGYVQHRSTLLSDMGTILRDQGKYREARAAYEASLESKELMRDQLGQATAQGQLGALAMLEKNYSEAKQRYQKAVTTLKELHDLGKEATCWYQLGIIFRKEHNWAEAERCLRESLILNEQTNNMAAAARACGELGVVARFSGRAAETEGWHKRALNIFEGLKDTAGQAAQFNNIANFLLEEIRAGRAPISRLAEARSFAEQSLKIHRNLDASLDVSMTLHLLAEIADQEADVDAARRYRREERAAFAAFPGHRFRIDKDAGVLIHLLAAAAKQEELRPKIEALFPQVEEAGWQVSAPIRRLWAGERDWHALSEKLDRNSALLVLRVLETLDIITPITMPVDIMVNVR
ncbi:CHAT domain-containing protein [Sorangium sp. So ce854]|uniref:CHAT domain-containing tetratricopeptide repeat protein n=1 Tax=Sorangium sp. So ce854 TaxID=3133322 RepID=UPI003F5E6512